MGEARKHEDPTTEPAARVALAIAALMLVATSEEGPPPEGEPEYDEYTFQKIVGGPTAELGETTPSARYRVLVRVDGLAPQQSSTTMDPTASLAGRVSATGATGFPSVTVSTGRPGTTLIGMLSAQTTFQVAPSLGFQGNCLSPPEAPPCTATFYVQFARDDVGSGGGSVAVEWGLTFKSEVRMLEDPGRQRELPWTVEITPE